MTDLFLLSGVEEVVAFPTRKTPAHNDWYESAWRDADLTAAPEYEDKTVTLSYLLLRPTPGRLESARRELDKSTLLVAGYTLRPLRVERYEHRGGLLGAAPRCGILTLTARQPARDYIRELGAGATDLKAASSDLIRDWGDRVSLAGTPLHETGTLVKHAYSTALRPELSRRHDEDEVTPSREIVLSCLHQGSLLPLWRLINRIGALPLKVGGQTLNCYYTAMRDVKLHRASTLLSFDLCLQTCL